MLLVVLLLAALGFAACGGGGAKRPPAADRVIDAHGRTAQPPRETTLFPREAPTPPWQLWAPTTGVPELDAAEALAQRGDLQGAAAAFKGIAQSAATPELKREAELRLVGTMLKLGASKEALEEVSNYLRANASGTASADPAFSLIAAYAYLHQRDLDQTLAWLGEAYRKAWRQGPYARRAEEEAVRILQALPAGNFDAFSQRWSSDRFIGPLLTRERLRRARGGQPEVASQPNWYSPATYGGNGTAFAALPPLSAELPAAAGAVGSGVLVPRPDEPAALGVLLPLSGRFAEHAAHVREGIELAHQELDPRGRFRLEIADTRGDPRVADTEYERLATQSGVSIVLGPLLAETTEHVAERSRTIGVPFISFTKRAGIPQLGPAVFRLGATSEDQVAELLDYATRQLGVRRIAVLYPDTSSGNEFAALFRAAVPRYNADLTAEGSYQPGSEESVAQAVDSIAAQPAEAVFLADGLEGALPLLDRLKNSALKSAVLLGPAQWNDPIAVRGYGQLLDGSVYVTPFFLRSSRRNVAEFVDRFRRRFQHEPDLLAAQAYDAAALAIRVLSDPSMAGRNLIDALSSADTYQGVTGSLAVNSEGEISRRLTVLKIERGEIVEVNVDGAFSAGILDDQIQKAEVGRW